jgi:glycosyltransferase involved in cell wall biosynthesis
MKKINLLLVVCNNVLNGTERYVVDLAKNLNKNEFNIYVAVPLSGPLSAILKENDINEVIYDNGKLIYYSFNGLRNLYRIIKDLRIDIVHANAKFQPCIAGKLAGAKLNLESRHGIFYSKSQFENISLIRKLYENLKQYFVDRFIAISENDKKTLIKYFRINPKKVSVLYLGIDFKDIEKKSGSLPGYRKRDAQGEFIIGHIGRFTYQKAQEYLLQAFKKVSDKYPKSKLILIGNGENKKDILKYIQNNDLTDKVVLKDYIKEIYKEIQTFDLHILTSRFEGTPYVNFEAMALGVPVVTTDVGGVSNIFTSGYDAIITKVEDPEDTFKAIESLILDENLRRKLILNAFETVKKYDVKKMAIETARLYVSMFKN